MQEEEEKVTYLRWTNNACSKNELMRKSQEHDIEENKEKDNDFGGIEWDNELNQRDVEEDDSYFGSTAQDHARDHSKRRSLIAKFKKWVEGGDKTKLRRLVEREKNGAEDSCLLLARKSCSSAECTMCL